MIMGGERKYRRTLRSIRSERRGGKGGRGRARGERERRKRRLGGERRRKYFIGARARAYARRVLSSRRSSLNGSANQLAPGTRPITDFFLAYISPRREETPKLYQKDTRADGAGVYEKHRCPSRILTSTCERGRSDGGRATSEGG